MMYSVKGSIILMRATFLDIKRQANTVVAWKTRVYSSVAVDLAPVATLFPQTNLASACLVHLFPLTSGNIVGRDEYQVIS